jgi:hypothetical protein
MKRWTGKAKPHETAAEMEAIGAQPLDGSGFEDEKPDDGFSGRLIVAAAALPPIDRHGS